MPKLKFKNEIMKQSESASKVAIFVSDPQAKKQYGGARQYYLYAIKGEDHKGPIDIHRRYSDFDQLRNLLLKRWPGCYIASLPSKIKLAQSDEEFLEIRSKYLEKFLQELSKKRHIWESDEVQLFLRNNITDFDKVLSGLWKIEPQDVVYRYETYFKEYQSTDAAILDEQINAFSKYMATLLVKLQQLRNKSEELNNTQARYQRRYSKFLLTVLSSYQHKFLSYYHESENKEEISVFSAVENNEKKEALMETLKEVPLKILFEELKREKREIMAFQDVLREREEYFKEKARIQGKIKQHINKIGDLRTGKKSFFEKIRSISVEEEIKSHQKSVQKYQKQLQMCEKICDYIRWLIGSIEIKSFKEERVKSYYKMVKDIAKEEINIIDKEKQFWMAIAQNSNLNFDVEEEPSKDWEWTKKKEEAKGFEILDKEESQKQHIQAKEEVVVVRMKNQVDHSSKEVQKKKNQSIKQANKQQKVEIQRIDKQQASQKSVESIVEPKQKSIALTKQSSIQLKQQEAYFHGESKPEQIPPSQTNVDSIINNLPEQNSNDEDGFQSPPEAEIE